MERNAHYYYQFSRRSTNEIIYEGNVTGGNKQDCMNLAWDYLRKNVKLDYTSNTVLDDIKLYMKREES